MYTTPAPSTAAPTSLTPDLARYTTPVAVLVAVLVILSLTVRIIATPLTLAALIVNRVGDRLDRWLATLPLPPQPVRVTASRMVVSLPG